MRNARSAGRRSISRGRGETPISPRRATGGTGDVSCAATPGRGLRTRGCGIVRVGDGWLEVSGDAVVGGLGDGVVGFGGWAAVVGAAGPVAGYGGRLSVGGGGLGGGRPGAVRGVRAGWGVCVGGPGGAVMGSAEFRAEDEGFRTGIRDARRGNSRQRRPSRWFSGGKLGKLWWDAYGRGYDEGERERATIRGGGAD